MISAKLSRALIRLGRLEIHIAISNPHIDVRIFAQSYCVAIISLSLLRKLLDIEEDEIRKALLFKQESEWIE